MDISVRVRNRKDRSEKDENEDPIFYKQQQNGKKPALGQWAKYAVSLENKRGNNQNINIETFNMLIEWCKDHLTGKWLVDEYFFQIEDSSFWLFLNTKQDLMLFKLRWDNTSLED